jgi:hypothetical protein
MFGPFESSAVLLARARKHVDEFEAAEKWFTDGKPYKLINKIDPQSGAIFMVAKVTKPIPAELSAIAFDAVNCLRSALDHAVFDSAERLGGKPKPKYTKFPFGLTADDAANDLPRKHSEVPESIRPFFLSFEPYKGGKHALWEMNELRNSKIHRILEATVARTGNVGITDGDIDRLDWRVIDKWDSRHSELTILEIAAGSRAKVNMRVSVKIAFQEGTPFGTKRALEVLRELVTVTNGIAKGIEAETARLLEVARG